MSKNTNTKSKKEAPKKLTRITNTTINFLTFMGLGRNAEGKPISLHKDENGKTDRYKVVFVAFPQDDDSDLAPNNMHFVVSSKILNALKDAGFNAKDYGKGKTSCLAKPVYMTQSVLNEDGLTTTQTYNTLVDITVLEKDEDGEWVARTILQDAREQAEEEDKKKKSTKKSNDNKKSSTAKKSTKKVEDDEDEAEEDDEDEVIDDDVDENEEDPF